VTGGANPDEMGRSRPNDDVEQLLRGRPARRDRPLRGVAELVGETRRVFAASVDADVRTRHLAAMAHARSDAASPEPRRAYWNRRPPARAKSVAKVGALATGLVLVAGSAMAATGTLPEPAQRGIARVVRTVGLRIPGDVEKKAKPDTDKVRPETPAAQNRARAKAFTDAKKAWTRCVAAAAPAHVGPEPFDPEEACGPKPRPAEKPHPATSAEREAEGDDPEETGEVEGDTVDDADHGPDDRPGRPDDPGNSENAPGADSRAGPSEPGSRAFDETDD
jgi:hypothetical protein